ncbi:FAD-dependent oxidoreductase [Candidatus Neomicrothrix sp.]|uniref:FAD-dependent oxidoreductase n=1 Tax=Candidatus Neomicrothrix sp. TaxID=2719034 RepID=UPI0016B12953|nr:FAD-dependent oxidoreductase [Candidatus Microthrix sp.]MBK7323334.1 FAD-dependent oxidoreductase [Candidatus Microthrix sp.]MBL0205164.1 FAD-dependent oxidoreductase [Candidatus Microthrix sp.]NLH66247.1 FAD-dependent oxidoreductase [Candidatus Microthrix parvicella]
MPKVGVQRAHSRRWLLRAGRSVRVFEARPYLGGRIRSGEVPGGHADLGPTWFRPGEQRLSRLVPTSILRSQEPQRRCRCGWAVSPRPSPSMSSTGVRKRSPRQHGWSQPPLRPLRRSPPGGSGCSTSARRGKAHRRIAECREDFRVGSLSRFEAEDADPSVEKFRGARARW